ncbi:MAG: ABC transporter ATP-binding protein [Alphaproteobacteria bacterium]|nr:ABC transporter ATP-binding protein [Alphaproteobacteria bacterium]
MSENILSTKNIDMVFHSEARETHVLKDINIEIPKSKVIMLVGPSGCGKTTLLSILTGMLTPTKGSVSYKSLDLFGMDNSKRTLLRQKEIGLVFQQYNLINTLTAAENVAIPLLASGNNFEDSIKRASRILQILNLGDHVDFLPAKLSGGEQQRVAVARGLVHNPDFIVCDEPTASLDAKNGKNIIELLRNISLNKKKTVLIVTHDNRIFDYADLIIYMNDGRIEKQESRKGKNS